MNMELLVIILNIETLPHVITTYGPFYYNYGSEVVENSMTVMVMTHTIKQGLGLEEGTRDTFLEPFPQ